MAFNFHDLDHDEIRQFISDEINYDIANNVVYYSKRFNENGLKCYTDLLIKHSLTGTEETLAQELKDLNCFKEKEERNTAKGIIYVRVPDTAHLTLAEGEFNRFYIRAVCVKAIKNNKMVIVYRARHSDNPRLDSEMLIGQLIDPNRLLKDLRNNIGIDTSFGLPNGPNSGLSVRIE